MLDADSATDLRTSEAAHDDDGYSGMDFSIETAKENRTQLVLKVTDRIEETQSMAPAPPRKPPQSHPGKEKSSLLLITAKIDQNLVLV